MELKRSGRNYGIDALRILSMFLVVMLHTLGHGGVLGGLEPGSAHYRAAWLLETAAYCAVNCFALTSGYVSCRSRPKFSRLGGLWLQTVFYTVLLAVVFCSLYDTPFFSDRVHQDLLPVTGRHYWYITSYFGLYLLTPLLNAAIEHTPRRAFTLSLAGAFVFFCGLPTLLHADPYKIGVGYSLIWLCLLYLLGGYFRKYDVLARCRPLFAWLLYLGAVAVTFLSKYVIEYIVAHNEDCTLRGNMLVEYTSPTIVLAGIGLFIACAGLTFPRPAERVIAFLSPAALGVYLIHANQFTWHHVMKDIGVRFAACSPAVMVLAVLLCALCIYGVCTLIELARIYLFRLLRVDALLKKADPLFDKPAERAVE